MQWSLCSCLLLSLPLLYKVNIIAMSSIEIICHSLYSKIVWHCVCVRKTDRQRAQKERKDEMTTVKQHHSHIDKGDKQGSIKV